MLKRNQNIGLFIFRLSLGILMFFHGFHKLMNGVKGIKEMLAEKGMPEFLAYGVHLGETIAPILIIIGYRTRLASLAFSIVMVVAFWLAHSSDLFVLTKSGAWKNELIALYLLGGVGLFFTGAGKYAVSTKSKWD
ncbi:MAG: DoxX family protein [Chitinophagaceae bacterium]|nr:DoxX family protein [Chitinophagaceae bacterium]HMN32535.1 DoxX family protein [Chitinophagaceae bacterium]